MQASALNNEIKKQVTSSWSLFIQLYFGICKICIFIRLMLILNLLYTLPVKYNLSPSLFNAYALNLRLS